MIKKSAAFIFFILFGKVIVAQITSSKNIFFQNEIPLTIGFQTLSGVGKDTLYNPHRVTILAIGVGTTYAVSMTGLYALWYRDYPSSRFHIFNDASEWLQMDKIGHVGSAYYLSRWSTNLVAWTGTTPYKSAWLGAVMGFTYQTTIEVFDGFSSQWGFSLADIAANTAGSALFLSQQLIWEDQRIQLKFSFHQSQFANYRPSILGQNFRENLFKDYNGQTYWLSANIHSWLPSSSKFPKWLNVAVGYGAEGMIGANENPSVVDGNSLPAFKRYRQFYLAPDIDLTKIQTHSELLNTLFQIIGFIKFPAPVLEMSSKRRIKFRSFYF